MITTRRIVGNVLVVSVLSQPTCRNLYAYRRFCATPQVGFTGNFVLKKINKNIKYEWHQ